MARAVHVYFRDFLDCDTTRHFPNHRRAGNRPADKGRDSRRAGRRARAAHGTNNCKLGRCGPRARLRGPLDR
eukprot:scaffold76016_cov75-Phaeocystis_antarctica.AAC.8